ncbi:DgyrCDS9273 [Dimorphilus gyrociliatus]|nr:DgyrCDS9273 [Dimorphilus gyrociliatus]
MIRNSMEYRAQNDMINIDKYDPPEVIKRYSATGLFPTSKDGYPFQWELFGRLDMKGLMYSCKKSDLEMNTISQAYKMEKYCRQQTVKMNKLIDGIIVIFDMEKCGTSHLWRSGIQMYMYLVQLLEDNYPEMVKYLYVINAPAFLPILYRIAKPLLSDDMRNKIQFLGSDFRQRLIDKIGAEYLPQCLGGTLTGPNGDARCCHLATQGGKIPESYYLKNVNFLDHLEKVTVPRADKLVIKFQVEEKDSILKWEFQTNDKDIGFGISFRGNEKEKKILPITRINSHIVPEYGSLVCENLGLYKVIFDNSFSWTKSKVLFYNIELCVKGELEDLQEDLKKNDS